MKTNIEKFTNKIDSPKKLIITIIIAMIAGGIITCGIVEVADKVSEKYFPNISIFHDTEDGNADNDSDTEENENDESDSSERNDSEESNSESTVNNEVENSNTEGSETAN